MTMKVTPSFLLEKLEQLDDRLLNLWVVDSQNLDDDDIWEIFVVLLETRVELLKTCRDAGIKLDQETCLPGWLERLVSSKREVRLRELKAVSTKLKQRRKIQAFETVASAPGDGARKAKPEEQEP